MRWTSVSLDVKLHIVIVQGALTNYVIGSVKILPSGHMSHPC